MAPITAKARMAPNPRYCPTDAGGRRTVAGPPEEQRQNQDVVDVRHREHPGRLPDHPRLHAGSLPDQPTNARRLPANGRPQAAVTPRHLG